MVQGTTNIAVEVPRQEAGSISLQAPQNYVNKDAILKTKLLEMKHNPENKSPDCMAMPCRPSKIWLATANSFFTFGLGISLRAQGNSAVTTVVGFILD